MLAPLSVQPQDPIRNSVLGKAGRYGDLNAPYIIAVNAMSTYAGRGVRSMRYSVPVVSVRQTADGFEDRIGRDTDGVWHGPGGPINTRVSAVLSTERLRPWSLAQRRARTSSIHGLADLLRRPHWAWTSGKFGTSTFTTRLAHQFARFSTCPTDGQNECRSAHRRAWNSPPKQTRPLLLSSGAAPLR